MNGEKSGMKFIPLFVNDGFVNEQMNKLNNHEIVKFDCLTQ